MERLRKFSPDYFEGSGKIMDNINPNLKMSDLVSALSSRNEADMDKYAASEILLCMGAYYKVSALSPMSLMLVLARLRKRGAAAIAQLHLSDSPTLFPAPARSKTNRVRSP